MDKINEEVRLVESELRQVSRQSGSYQNSKKSIHNSHRTNSHRIMLTIAIHFVKILYNIYHVISTLLVLYMLHILLINVTNSDITHNNPFINSMLITNGDHHKW